MTSARPATAETGTRRGLAARVRLLAVLSVATVLLLWPVKLPPVGWWPLWWNWMHVPLFGWIALEGARFVRVTRGWHGWRAAVSVLASAALLATGAEYLQHASGRQTDWEDAARSLAGATGALALLEALRSSLFRRSCLIVLAIFCLLGSANALLQRALLLHQKASAFPLLEDFETATSLSLWSLEHDGLPQPLLRKQVNGRWLLEMPITSTGLSSLRHDAQSRDWTRYRTLVLRYRLEDMPTLHLGLRLDGGSHGSERHYLETHLQPGSHRAVIPLPTQPDGKASMLSSIDTLTLFSSGGPGGMLAIEDLRLE